MFKLCEILISCSMKSTLQFPWFTAGCEDARQTLSVPSTDQLPLFFYSKCFNIYKMKSSAGLKVLNFNRMDTDRQGSQIVHLNIETL